MPRLIDVRLTILGSENLARRFEESNWPRALGARHIELFEFREGRRVWWFQTIGLNAKAFTRLSMEWPDLTLFIDYEDHTVRAKGLIKLTTGKIARCDFDY